MRINTSYIMVVAASLAVAIVPALAEARSTSGFGVGKAAPGEDTCWYESFGAAVNVCGSQQRLTLPVIADSTGTNYSVTMNVYAQTPTNTVGCYAQGRTKDATQFWSGATKYPSSFGSAQDVALGSVWIPSGGMMDVYCTVNYGGQVNSIRY